MPFFLSILQSLSTIGFYSRVLDHSFGKIVWLLARFFVLIVILNALSLIPFSQQIIEKTGTWIQSHLPEMKMDKGVLEAQEPLPFFHNGTFETLSGTNETYSLALDTRSTDFPSLPEATPESSIAFSLAREGMKIETFKTPYKGAQVISFKNFPDGRIDKDYIVKYFSTSAAVAIVFFGMLGFGIMTLFFWFVLNSFFIGTTYILERITGSVLSIGDLARIALCATIPATLICSVYFWLRFFLLDINIVYMIIYAVYFFLGTTVARKRRVMDLIERNPQDDDQIK